MVNSITEETIKQLANQVKAQQSMIETLEQEIMESTQGCMD